MSAPQLQSILGRAQELKEWLWYYLDDSEPRNAQTVRDAMNKLLDEIESTA